MVFIKPTPKAIEGEKGQVRVTFPPNFFDELRRCKPVGNDTNFSQPFHLTCVPGFRLKSRDFVMWVSTMGFGSIREWEHVVETYPAKAQHDFPMSPNPTAM
jgi:hypothetical protein